MMSVLLARLDQPMKIYLGRAGGVGAEAIRPPVWNIPVGKTSFVVFENVTLYVLGFHAAYRISLLAPRVNTSPI